MTPMHVCVQRTGGTHMPHANLPQSQCAVDSDPSEAGPDVPCFGRDVEEERRLRVLKARLDGAAILLIEDEAIVAMDIKFALNDAGADVLGPAASLSDALSLAQETPRIDGAILDIDLEGEHVFQLADLLVSRSVPFLFHTGGPCVAEVETRFPDTPLLRKPVAVEDLLLSLVDRIR